MVPNTKQIDITPLLDCFLCLFQSTIIFNKNVHIVGIHRGGVWLAKWLHTRLKLDQPIGELDISFYRDDFSTNGLHPKVQPSTIPFNVDNSDIIIVDDVILSGRTIRAALNEIFDYGRPNSVRLACLIDLEQRQLPIRPDIVAKTMQLAANQRLKLTGPQPLELCIHTVEPQL